MKKFISNKFSLYTIGLLLFFVLWIVISVGINEPKMIFPNPWDTFSYLGGLFTTPFFWMSLGMTTLRMIVGFVIAFIVALILGALAGRFKRLYYILKPTMTVLKAVPTAAVVFLFLVLVGYEQTPIMIVILMAFPILYEAVTGGIQNTEETILEAARVDGGNTIKNLVHIQIPLAFPYILVGLASSFAVSFKIEIMAEIIAGNNGYGIGSAIKYFRTEDPSNMVPVFAYSVIAIIVVLVIDLIGLAINKKVKIAK